jgi:hypothetical protein
VALETTLFFSLPGWLLFADDAWPVTDLSAFLQTILVGAFLAMLLCHVCPALWVRDCNVLEIPRVSRTLALLPRVWLLLGAALALVYVARFVGGMFFMMRWSDPIARISHELIAAACSMGAAAVVFSGPRLLRGIALLAVTIGAGVLVALFLAQWPGLWIRNPQLSTESGLNNSSSVMAGILLAAAPAVVLAARVGRMRVSTRKIWLTGLVGVAGPVVLAVLLASLAKVGGVRLHWKPSIPIEFISAFWGWHEFPLKALVPLAGVTAIGPVLVCALWIRDLMPGFVDSRWKRVVTVVLVGVLSLSLMLLDYRLPWGPSYVWPWLWSVIGVGALAGLAVLIRWLRFRG